MDTERRKTPAMLSTLQHARLGRDEDPTAVLHHIYSMMLLLLYY